MAAAAVDPTRPTPHPWHTPPPDGEAESRVQSFAALRLYFFAGACPSAAAAMVFDGGCGRGAPAISTPQIIIIVIVFVIIGGGQKNPNPEDACATQRSPLC